MNSVLNLQSSVFAPFVGMLWNENQPQMTRKALLSWYLRGLDLCVGGRVMAMILGFGPHDWHMVIFIIWVLRLGLEVDNWCWGSGTRTGRCVIIVVNDGHFTYWWSKWKTERQAFFFLKNIFSRTNSFDDIWKRLKSETSGNQMP